MKITLKHLILVFFATLIPSFVMARTLMLDEEKNKCITSLLNHQYTKIFLEQKNENNNEDIRKKTLNELDDYCKCSADYLLSYSDTNKLKHSSSWTFQDNKEELKSQDLCAKDNLSPHLSTIVYYILLSGEIQNNLIRKLIDRYHYNIKYLASQDSMSKNISCMQTTIMQECTESKSLVQTYLCIQGIITDQRLIDNISSTCPRLTTHDIDIYKYPRI